MSLSFDAFTSASRDAQHYFVRPYGIYYRGEVFWDAKLPRRKGAVVRFFEDNSGPCRSLIVFSADGVYLCNAWPVSWVENDHEAQHEMEAWLLTLTDEERREFL